MIVSSCSCWLYPPISPYFPSCSSLLIISTPPPHMTFVYSGIGLGSICIGSYSTTGKKKTKMLVTCIDNQLGDSVRLIYRSQSPFFIVCRQHAQGEIIMVTRPEKKRRSWALLLLPPIYNYNNPELIGIPFFYWFQLLVILLTAALTAALYFSGA